jgi:hypothetical protein
VGSVGSVGGHRESARLQVAKVQAAIADARKNNILAAGLAVTVCGAKIRPDRHGSKGQLRKAGGRDAGNGSGISAVRRNGKKQKPKS